jgi:hypothetical protein
MLALVALVAGIIGALTPGYVGDIEQGKTWARQLVRNGMADAYRTDTDGAPVILYPIAAAGCRCRAAIDPERSERAAKESHSFTVLLKAPMILAHVAITGVIYLIAASNNALPGRSPVVVALAYGMNPATLYDSAHFGQTDPLLGLAAILFLAGYQWRSGVLLGIGAAALLLGKPQGWILLPIIGLATITGAHVRTLTMAGVSVVVTSALLLSPWLIAGRANHVWRYIDNLSGHDISNRVISADAHNLWWIPTLIHGDWIEDSVTLIGPLSYRAVAITLALAWLVVCLAAVFRRPPGKVGIAAAAASFGFFMLMTRAHENHSYLALTLLLGAVAASRGTRQIWTIVCVLSLGLLANLVLRDPLIMGPNTSVPDLGAPAPAWIIALQIANVAVFGAALVLFIGALFRTKTDYSEAQAGRC